MSIWYLLKIRRVELLFLGFARDVSQRERIHKTYILVLQKWIHVLRLSLRKRPDKFS